MNDGNRLSDRLRDALERIDAMNAKDPRRELWQGTREPKELLYGRRMSAWLERLAPDASDALRIAARAQHICRWEHPRSTYPEGRAGYLRWRTDLYGFHADKAAELMRAAGYGEAEVERVRALLSKRLIKRDPEAATLEDVACLVFLEFYLADFAPDHDREKMIGILRKSWGKMSAAGRAAALTIELSPEAKALVREALADGN